MVKGPQSAACQRDIIVSEEGKLHGGGFRPMGCSVQGPCTSSGSTVKPLGSSPVMFFTNLKNAGMRVAPPTSSTWDHMLHVSNLQGQLNLGGQMQQLTVLSAVRLVRRLEGFLRAE